MSRGYPHGPGPPQRPLPPAPSPVRVVREGHRPERNAGNNCRECVFLVPAWFGLARRCVSVNMHKHLRAWDAPRCNNYGATTRPKETT